MTWKVRSRWTLVGGEPEPFEYTERFGTFEAARRHGRQSACCAGALHIVVLSPNGDIVSTWDRSDNAWRDDRDMPGLTGSPEV